MAKRQSVNFPGFAHQNPIPNASRIGNVMMSSVISGVDPGTRNMPPELAKQVTNLFTHVRTAVASAGGTPDDIIKMIPDAASRPARHTMALGAESNALVTCEFVAVFG